MQLTRPTHADLMSVLREAEAKGLQLVTDSIDIMYAPAHAIPPGWRRMAVKIKPQPLVQEGMRCAA